MGVTTKILQAIKNDIGKGEMALWHGTGVHPDELAKGAGSIVEPKFSSEFFKKGTGGMVQGPGLYASESAPVGRKYAELVGAAPAPVKVYPRGMKYDDWISNIIPTRGDYWTSDVIKDLDKLALTSADKTEEFAFRKGEMIRRLDQAIKNWPYQETSYYEGPKDALTNILSEIRSIKKKDFKWDYTDPERYLYKVAFPKERYLDWYNPDTGSKDIFDYAVKEHGITPLKHTPVDWITAPSGDSTIQILGNKLRTKFEADHADDFRRVMDMMKYPREYKTAEKISAQLHKKGDALVSDQIIDIFNKAGFAGTKYRGDQQQGNYFNYVLMKPERARILDAFKFGIGGAALSPFLSQPQVQSGRSS